MPCKQNKNVYYVGVNPMEIIMKKIIAALFVFASVSAIASPATNEVQHSISSPDVSEHFVTSSSQPLSRAQVQQELTQAQKDGSLADIKSWGRGGH